MNLVYWKNGLINKYKKLALPLKATIWFTVCAFLQKAFAVFTMPIFTRLMSTEEYGEYSVFVSVNSILTVIITLNITSVLATKGINRYGNNAEQFLVNVQFLGSCSVLFFSTILLCCSERFCTLFGINKISLYFALAQIFVIPAFEIWSAKQRYEYNYRKIVIFTLSYLLINSTVGVGVVFYASNKGEARILSYCIIQIILYGFLYVVNLKVHKVKLNWEMIGFALKFNLPLVPHGVANQVLARSDILMIQYFQGTSYSGIYSLGYNIASLAVMLTTSINNVYVPWLYKKLDINDYVNIRKKSTYMLAVIFFCVTMMILVAPEIVKVFAPDTYAKAEYVIAPVAVGIAFTMVYTLFVNVELYYEKTIMVMLGTVGVAVLNIILNCYFIPQYGFIAAAYTTLISYIGYAIMHFICVIKLCGNRINVFEIYDIKRIWLLSIAQIVMLFITIILYPYCVLRYFLIVLGIIIVFINRNNFKKKLKI